MFNYQGNNNRSIKLPTKMRVNHTRSRSITYEFVKNKLKIVRV
jgi:hypothetical protein